MENTCPACGMHVEPIFNYCPQCGKSLAELFHGVGIARQIAIYLISLLLPPFGLVWTVRYSKYPSTQVKMVGVVALMLTIVSVVVTGYVLYLFINQLQSEFGKYNSLYNTTNTINSLGF